MDSSWFEAIKAIGSASGVALSIAKNRSYIRDAIQQVLGDSVEIVVTGAGGAGKSVLVDGLLGKVFEDGYQAGPRDQILATAKTKQGKQSWRIKTIPGQGQKGRIDALENVFKNRFDGVIHVVANGFLDPKFRSAIPEDDIRRGYGPGIDAYAEKCRAADELDDFERVADLLENYWTKNLRPFWFLLVLAKIDLYHSEGELQGAQRWYWSDQESPFVKRLTRLRGDIGRLNMVVGHTPVFILPEDFRWNQGRRPTQIDFSPINFVAKTIDEIQRLQRELRP